jgi:VanZ family protein
VFITGAPLERIVKLPLVPTWARYALVVGALAAIVTFSVVPLPSSVTDAGPLGLFPVRRYLHLLAYAGFALVLGYALADSPRPDWQVLAIVFLVAFGVGAAMELLQLTLPRRHSSVRDVLANAAGASIAVGLWRILRRRVRLYRVGRSLELPV